MTMVEDLINWVQRKPVIVIRFNRQFSEALYNSRQGFEHLTFTRPHAELEPFELPTPCLLEIRDDESVKCYLATVIRKRAVSTFDSRLTIKKLRAVYPDSLQAMASLISDSRMKRLLKERLPDEGRIAKLSPTLSAHIVKLLAAISENRMALETVLSLLPGLRRVADTSWAQEDAIRSAMAVFGLSSDTLPEQLVLKRGTSSGLGLIGTYLYEDNIVRADASQLPGFEMIFPDVTGRAVFVKEDERLEIYTANKLPLEQMLGVDLIYVNKTRGNIVMIQYKMLEEVNQENRSGDWLFRPDCQLYNEIDRMLIPEFNGFLDDYRLNRNPFFFKFVKRKIIEDTHQSFFISLDHLIKMLESPKYKGPRGGIRLSYEALDGTYLRKADMLGLIRSGYIGTHRAETEALAVIIEQAAQGNKALVLAWQQRRQEMKQEKRHDRSGVFAYESA